MSVGVWFWLLMALWLIFGCYWNRAEFGKGNYGLFGGNLMLFVLLFLLGFRVFGSPLQ
jgi:hypothetical protein